MAKRPNGTGSIYLRGRIWWIQYYRQGKPYNETSESTDKEDAEKLLHKRLGEIAEGRFQGLTPERVTLSQLCELVCEDYRLSGKRSAVTITYRIEQHIAPAVGKVRASQFGSLHIKRYVAQRREEGAEDSTINRELAVIRRGFNLALRADPPMVVRAPHFPRLEESNVRQGFIEHDQYVKLRDALPRHLKALFVVGYHTGARVGELRKVDRHTQLDLGAGEIRLFGEQTKNKRPRTLPVYGEMKLWLEIQVEELKQKFPACPWLFHYYGRAIGAHLKGWTNACKTAGLPALHFHDLRRTAVRNMERAGIPRKVAMEISGHRTESVYRRYDIVNQRDLRIAAAKLETYLNSQVVATETATVEGDTTSAGKAN
jgi:integrase